MTSYKRLYSAVETAEKTMNEWSDEQDNKLDIVVLPPEKGDDLSDKIWMNIQ